jgi:hypothetical protein
LKVPAERTDWPRSPIWTGEYSITSCYVNLRLGENVRIRKVVGLFEAFISKREMSRIASSLDELLAVH